MTREAHSTVAVVVSPGADDVGEALGVVVRQRDLPSLWVRSLWAPGEARGLVDEARALGIRRFVAVGGDGTVQALLEAIGQRGELGTDLELAVVPQGTANDLAAQLGVSDLTVTAALEHAVLGPSRRVAVGRCNDRWFLNMATLGPASRASVDAPRELKDLAGPVAYVLQGLSRLSEVRGFPATVRAGEQTFEGRWMAIYVGNGTQAGGGFRICPEAHLTDPKLQLVLVQEAPLMRLLPLALATALDEVRESDVCHRALHAEVTVEGEAPIEASLDGEPYEAQVLHLRGVPDAVRLVVPLGATQGGSG